MGVFADNLFPDSYVKNAAFWTSDPHGTGLGGYQYPTSNVWYIDGEFPSNPSYSGTSTPWVLYTGNSEASNLTDSVNGAQVLAPRLSGIKASTPYRLSARANNASNWTVHVVIQFWDAQKNYLSGTEQSVSWASGASGDREKLFTSPPGAAYYRIYVHALTGGPGVTYSGAIWIGAFQILDAVTGNLIVQNSITGNHLQANTVTAGNMAADSVSTNALQAGAVTAAKVSVTSLSALTATIGTLRTASAGARTEIKDNLIEVYDWSNVRRVRMGVF